MHSGNFNRYFSVYSNRCTQRTEDDRTVRKVLYAYDRDSSLIRADRPVCRLEEDRKHGICRSRVYRYADTCAFAWEELYP